MLKVRLLSVVNDEDIPVAKKEYVAFALQAGVSQPAAYKAWKVDPICQGHKECVSGNHVVLTQPGENRQASQVTGQDGILETRKSLSKREHRSGGTAGENSRIENPRSEKSELSASEAIKALHNGGVGGKLIA